MFKKSKEYILTGGLILVTASQGLMASEPNWFAIGLKAEFSLDYSEAINAYKKAVPDHGAQASYALSRIYNDINDTEQHFYWLTQASKSGSSFAQYELGLAYIDGSSGADKDIDKAIMWLEAATRSNHGEAAYELFLTTSSPDALVVAGEQGVLEACLKLEQAYEQGLYGFPIDLSFSQYWADQASSLSDEGV